LRLVFWSKCSRIYVTISCFLDTLRGAHRPLDVDGPDILILDFGLLFYRIHIVDAEGQDIPIVDGVHNGVRVELVAEGLRCGQQRQMLALRGVFGKNRRASKPKQVVLFECLDDLLVHIPELAAVALIKDNDAVLAIYGVALVLRDEIVQLLNRSDDDAGFCVLQLTLQDGR
jgi:hypothetical protein